MRSVLLALLGLLLAVSAAMAEKAVAPTRAVRAEFKGIARVRTVAESKDRKTAYLIGRMKNGEIWLFEVDRPAGRVTTALSYVRHYAEQDARFKISDDTGIPHEFVRVRTEGLTRSHKHVRITDLSSVLPRRLLVGTKKSFIGLERALGSNVIVEKR